ncbi:MAG: EAL domain-containing protein [Lachnospiraceae bacterium]|nr:EAL domain-containing protein [Lachnospiraceae bacterium]
MKRELNEAEERQFIIEHLDEAIDKGELVVYFQPVIRALTEKLSGFEALVRWISPELGFLPPDRFIPVLEEENLISRVDIFVINEVCRLLHQYEHNGGHGNVPVSINLSVLDLNAMDMCQVLIDATEKYNISRDMLHVELTESVMATDEQLVRDRISRFHEEGFEVWMDDFGSGYSTLNSLKDYEFDVLKLDMKFLSSNTEKSWSIMQSIVALAKNIGVGTVAEGCETEEQVEMLRRIGCDKIQGYYFGKPMSHLEINQQIVDRGIDVETMSEADFYGHVSHIEYPTSSAICIMELDGETLKPWYISEEYAKILRDLHFSSFNEFKTAINAADDDNNYNTIFKQRIRSVEIGTEEAFVTEYRGVYLSLKVLKIYAEEDKCIIRVSLMNTNIFVKTQDYESEDNLIENEADNVSHKRQTIMIVEDDDINKLMLANMLNDKYNLVLAKDGLEALELFEERGSEIDIIMLDMVLPEIDGIGVIKRIRRSNHDANIPIIVMTAAINMEKEIFEAGANQLITKPFDMPEVILARIESVLQLDKVNRLMRFSKLDYLPTGVVVCKADEDETLLYATAKMVYMFGCSSIEELMEYSNGSFNNIVYEEDLDMLITELEGFKNSGDDEIHLRYRIKTKNGEIKYINDYTKMVSDSEYGNLYYSIIAEH